MEYNKNKLITDDGNNLVSQSLQEGQKVNFDSIIITDTPLPSDRQLSAMTVDNFKNARKYSITTLKKGKNSVQPEARLDNNGLTADYPIQAIGLLAHVGESNSTLFGITQNSEGTPAMLTKQSQTPYFITYDMAITVTNPDNYTATITPAGYVDQTTFDNTTQDIYTKIDGLETKADAKAAHDKLSNKIDHIDLSKYETTAAAQKAHDGINGRIDELDKESVLPRGEINENNDYNSLTQPGIYYRAGYPKNGPQLDGFSAWGPVKVENRADAVMQTIYDTVGTGRKLYRCFTSNYDTGWQVVATQYDTDKLDNKINDLFSRDLYKVKTIDENTDISALHEAGTYTCFNNILNMKGVEDLKNVWLSDLSDPTYWSLTVTPKLQTWQYQILRSASGTEYIRGQNNGSDFKLSIDGRCSWHRKLDERDIDRLHLSINDGKLMYAGKPILVANAPNAPKLEASINADTGNLDYEITPPSVDGGASITRYQLSYKKQSDNDWKIIDVDAGSHNGTLTNLDKGTIYQLKAVAINYAGAGIGSDTVSVLTAVAPKGVTISVTNNYPKVSYSINVENNGGASVNNYQVFYKKDTDTMWQLIDHASANGEINNLDENTNYSFKAKAQNVAGISDDSNTVNLNFIDNRIYGASWNQSADSTLTRTDAAVGMIAGINGNRNDFDKTGLWGGMHRVTDDKGNVFVRIPKFYIKKTQTSGLSTWQVSLVKPDDSWYLPRCFWNFDKNQELPYVDVGAYLANWNVNVLESKINTAPVNNFTTSVCGSMANNNGKGYQQLDIHVWDCLQVLFIIEFATLDSKSIMYGSATNYNSAYTDHMIGSSAGDSNNIKYRGIESLYCNMAQWIDGVNVSSGNIYVCDDANNYQVSNFSYPYIKVGYSLPNRSGFNIRMMGFDPQHPEVSLPSNQKGDGYYCDISYNNLIFNSNIFVGGSQGSLFFSSMINDTSYESYGVSARLVRKAI